VGCERHDKGTRVDESRSVSLGDTFNKPLGGAVVMGICSAGSKFNAFGSGHTSGVPFSFSMGGV
jgi:hypothetical protein